jgi:hypothetical protein
MLASVLPAVVSFLGNTIDKAVKDKDVAEKLKAEITLEAMKAGNNELQQAVQVILAEANGKSWMQRNWRPVTMLVLVALIAAHWLGYTAPNLTEQEIVGLLDIVKVGLGGYVLGRSGEKMVQAYKK